VSLRDTVIGHIIIVQSQYLVQLQQHCVFNINLLVTNIKRVLSFHQFPSIIIPFLHSDPPTTPSLSDSANSTDFISHAIFLRLEATNSMVRSPLYKLTVSLSWATICSPYMELQCAALCPQVSNCGPYSAYNLLGTLRPIS